MLERWQHSIATGEPFEMVFPLRGADGVFRPFLTRVVPVRNEEGRVTRWFGTNTDITDQRAAEDTLRRLNELLEQARRRRGRTAHGGRGSPAAVAENGGDRSADGRHRPRFQQHSARHPGQSRGLAAGRDERFRPPREGRVGTVCRERGARRRAGRDADPALARVRPAATAQPGSARRQPPRRERVRPVAPHARRDDQRGDRARRRLVAHDRRRQPARKRAA